VGAPPDDAPPDDAPPGGAPPTDASDISPFLTDITWLSDWYLRATALFCLGFFVILSVIGS
jgi:hypothetical protein